MDLKLYRTFSGNFIQHGEHWVRLPDTLGWESLLQREDLYAFLGKQYTALPEHASPPAETWLAPIANQEVWAAGVTYLRSRAARVEESGKSGGSSFYDLVYDADRPELFFKATPHRVVGPGGWVKIRSDSKWNVPEPELALLLAPTGKLIGYTVGNDMSSRDIEGENPLYLPQAKVYDRCCSLGPCILLSEAPLAGDSSIRLVICREREIVFEGATTISMMKRPLETLIDYLFRDNLFPSGVFLLTGTGIVPDPPFTLQTGDVSEITIDAIGTLANKVN